MNPDFKQQIGYLTSSPEETIQITKVCEKLAAGQFRNCPTYTMFLSPREKKLVQDLFRKADGIYFWGGYPDAERTIACYLPHYLDPGCLAEEAPIRCIRASYYERDQLSHRDFLGAILGLGIKREALGDILVGSGCCDFIVTQELSSYILNNLTKAGRTALHLEELPMGDLIVPEKKVEQLRTTVASLRFDCIVSAAWNVNRSQASELIVSGRAMRNDLVCLKTDQLLEAGDILSVRGYGKLKLNAIGQRTKKGRTVIELSHYL